MMDQGHNHVLNINVVDLTHFCLICQHILPHDIQVLHASLKIPKFSNSKQSNLTKMSSSLHHCNYLISI